MNLIKKITPLRIMKLAIASFAIYWIWGCTQPPKMYIVGAYGAIKIEVPAEIVKSKDCKKFEAFTEGLTRPGFVPNVDCPWAKVGKIGYFVLDAVEFAVPREYLWQGSKDPDGISDGLYFMFKYPTFEGASASGDQSMNIKVTMVSWINEITLYDGGIKADPALNSYFGTSGIEFRLDELLASKDLSKYIKDAPEVGMKAFVHKGMVRAYFTGDLLHPKEWMYCAPDLEDRNPQCEGSFMYKNNNHVKFLFSRRGLMQDHWNIRKQIKAKLDEFHKKGKEAAKLRAAKK